MLPDGHAVVVVRGLVHDGRAALVSQAQGAGDLLQDALVGQPTMGLSRAFIQRRYVGILRAEMDPFLALNATWLAGSVKTCSSSS